MSLPSALAYSTEHVEIAIFVEDARIEQFVFEILIAPARVLSHQVFVGEARLGIFVEHLHVAVRRRAVEVEIVFLDILAVIALRAGQAEQPLLQDRIMSIPERQREAEILVAVANSGESILVPAIGAAASVVVREVRPGAAIVAVVFADSSPGALTEVRPPVFPVGLLIAVVG